MLPRLYFQEILGKSKSHDVTSFMINLLFRGKKKKSPRDFLDGPVIETLHLHCRRHRFDPWLGN